MTFDEIAIRMNKLKVDRAWLAAQCDYTRGSLAAILAPNGNQRHKTDKALRRIWEALDREEERQRLEPLLPTTIGNSVVLEPTKAQFDKWMRCAYADADGDFDAWAKAGLDAIADAELPALLAARRQRRLGEPLVSRLKVADDPESYGEDQAAP